MFASGSTDNIKQWQTTEGVFYQNLTGHNSMINAMAINDDGVLVSGGLFFQVEIKENTVL